MKLFQLLKSISLADLWDDFGRFIYRRSGWFGQLMLTIAELFAGEVEVVGDRILNRTNSQILRDANQADQRTRRERVAVRREISEVAVLSEVLSTVSLLFVIFLDYISSVVNYPGMPLITSYPEDAASFPQCHFLSINGNRTLEARVFMANSSYANEDMSLFTVSGVEFNTNKMSANCIAQESQDKRVLAMSLYAVVLSLQVLGLCMSRHISTIRHEFERRLEATW